MPLRPDLRNLSDANGDLIYRGPVYQARRERLLERADHKCERCRAPNRRVVVRAHLDSWKDGDHWYSPDGLPPRAWVNIRRVRIVLNMAHLTHDPLRNEDDELAMLCQLCHFRHDKQQHKETRSARKDAARPLLAAINPQTWGAAFEAAGRVAAKEAVVDPWPAFAAAYGLEASL